MNLESESLIFEEDYYRLLNVSREASNEEITAAYRKFSRIFHPDKHSTNDKKRKTAQQVFNKIKEAYDVLMDSKKRAIYDTMGKRGLEVEGWQVVYKSRTPKEIRDEYERLRKEREEKLLEQTTSPKGTITMTINASEFFQTYSDEYDIPVEPDFRDIEISGINIHQSINAPISARDTLTISGGVSTQNGIGSGNVNVSNRHYTSEDFWTEYDVGVGNTPLIGMKVFKRISKMMFLNTAVSTHFTPRGIAPSFAATISMQMDEHSVGHLSYKIGKDGSSMSTSYIWGTEKVNTSSAIQIGSPHSYISLNFVYKPGPETKIRLALKYGTFGALVEYGAEKEVSKHCRVSAALAFGIPTGVLLKLKLVYCSQTIMLPIQLSEEVMMSPVCYGTVLPIFSWMVLKTFVLDPIASEKEQKKKMKLLEANFERVQQMQKEARAAVELMRDSALRVKSEEEKKNGLIIIRAIYGKLEQGAKEFVVPKDHDELLSLNDENIDVTVQLQCLVKDSRLELLAATKVDLPGFFDTHIGEKKHLTILYSYRNNMYKSTFPDNSVVILPRPGHRIKNN